MKLNRAGFTASAVLIVAVLGGATGGALAMSGQQTPAPAPTQQVQTIAEEATATPTPTVTPTAEPVPADEPTVSEPTTTVEPMPRPETATEAADRAKVEADRAKQEADRAATVAATTAPAPATAPEDTGAVPKRPMTEEEAAAKAEMIKKHHDLMGEQLPGVNGYVPPTAEPTPAS